MDLPVKVHLARCLISWLNMMMAKKSSAIFKHEEDVDRLLAYVEVNFPQIPLHSEVAEQKLAEKAKRMEESKRIGNISETAKKNIRCLDNAIKYLIRIQICI